MDAPHGRWQRVERKSLTGTAQVILNKSLKQKAKSKKNSSCTATYLPIPKTIWIRKTRHAGHCWRSKDDLISDVLQWTTSHRCGSVGQPTRTYRKRPVRESRSSLEDLLEEIDDREEWRERVQENRASSATWWWWYFILSIFSYNHLLIVLVTSQKKSSGRHTLLQGNWNVLPLMLSSYIHFWL